MDKILLLDQMDTLRDYLNFLVYSNFEIAEFLPGDLENKDEEALLDAIWAARDAVIEKMGKVIEEAASEIRKNL